MNKMDKIKLFLVDDDALFLKLLEMELLAPPNNVAFEIHTYPTGELCLKDLSLNPDVIILDYHLNGVDKNAMNGLQTLDKIKEANPNTTVIMLSSQDKIEVAVNCMHHKALDYVKKSETAVFHIKKIIAADAAQKKTETQLKWYMDRM